MNKNKITIIALALIAIVGAYFLYGKDGNKTSSNQKPEVSSKTSLVTQEFAKEIKAQIDDYVNAFNQQLGDDAKLVTSSVDVTTTSDSYEVSIKDTKIQAEDFDFVFGTINAVLKPINDTGDFDAVLDIPNSFKGIDKEKNQEAIVIQIEKDNIQGIWSSQYKNFESYDFLLEGINVNIVDEKAKINIAQAQSKSNIKKVSDKEWSNDAKVEFKDIKVVSEKEAEGKQDVFSIGHIQLDGIYNASDKEVFSFDAQNKIFGLDDFKDGLDFKPEKISKEMIEKYLSSALLYDFDIKAKDIKSETVDLNELKIGYLFDHKKEDNAKFGIQLKHKGLNIKTEEKFKKLIPQNSEFDVVWTGFPFKKFMTALLDNIAKKEAEGQAQGEETSSQNSFEQWVAKLPQLLVEQKSTIKLDHLDLESEVYRLSTKGQFDAAQENKAIFGGTANINFEGMDKLIEEISQSSEKEVAPMIMMLKSVGQKDGGNDSYKYVIDVNKDGQLSVNNLDLTALMKSFGM